MQKRNLVIGGIILVFGIFLFFGFRYAQKKSASGQKEIILQNDSQIATQDSAQKEGNKNDAIAQPSDNSNAVPTEAVPAKPTDIKKESAKDNAAPLLGDLAPKSGLKIIDRLLSSGFEKSSGRTIDTIIIHSSYDSLGSDPYDISGIIAEYKSYEVSPHYIIDRAGTIYRLVQDQNIAYHAGVAKLPDGRTNVNQVSLGIEIVTTKTASLTDAQYAALQSLVNYLKGQYKIKYVLGHNQIAPSRKDDPWNFDWKKLK